jgi:hypothetical protein
MAGVDQRGQGRVEGDAGCRCQGVLRQQGGDDDHGGREGHTGRNQRPHPQGHNRRLIVSFITHARLRDADCGSDLLALSDGLGDRFAKAGRQEQ